MAGTVAGQLMLRPTSFARLLIQNDEAGPIWPKVFCLILKPSYLCLVKHYSQERFKANHALRLSRRV